MTRKDANLVPNIPCDIYDFIEEAGCLREFMSHDIHILRPANENRHPFLIVSPQLASHHLQVGT